jgi:hypothetical protein
MGLQELIQKDVYLMVENEQLENIRTIYNYVQDNRNDFLKVSVDYRDKFPRQIVKDSPVYFYKDRVYKYDLQLIPESIGGDGGATFIVDSEKIILRPFYSAESFSVNQRNVILDDFTNYLKKINKNFEKFSKD